MIRYAAAYHSLLTAALRNVQLASLPSTFDAESLERLSAAKRSVFEVSAGSQPFFQPSCAPVAFVRPIKERKQLGIIIRISFILQVTRRPKQMVGAARRVRVVAGLDSLRHSSNH